MSSKSTNTKLNRMLQTNIKRKGCDICGSKMVYIRGKYPQSKKRKICPTCAYERLEQINEISSESYMRAYKEAQT